jgi:hypothetical protein
MKCDVQLQQQNQTRLNIMDFAPGLKTKGKRQSSQKSLLFKKRSSRLGAQSNYEKSQQAQSELTDGEFIEASDL